MMPGDGEVALAVVNLKLIDLALRLVIVAQSAGDENLDTGAAGADFRIAIARANNLPGPILNGPGLRIATFIEVNTRKGRTVVDRTERKAWAAILLAGGDHLIPATPITRVGPVDVSVSL